MDLSNYNLDLLAEYKVNDLEVTLDASINEEKKKKIFKHFYK